MFFCNEENIYKIYKTQKWWAERFKTWPDKVAENTQTWWDECEPAFTPTTQTETGTWIQQNLFVGVICTFVQGSAVEGVWKSKSFSPLSISGGNAEVPPPAAGGEQEAGGADQNSDHEEGETAAPQRSAISAFHSFNRLW